MQGALKGKKAVVTGAGRGIGKVYDSLQDIPSPKFIAPMVAYLASEDGVSINGCVLWDALVVRSHFIALSKNSARSSRIARKRAHGRWKN